MGLESTVLQNETDAISLEPHLLLAWLVGRSGQELATRLLTMKPPASRDLLKGTALAIVYVVSARLGLQIHAVHHFATLVWPPTGIAMAAMLTLGARFWPAIAAGAFVANVWTGAPAPVALAIAAGNTLEALLAAYALRRIPGFRSTLDRLRDVVGLVVLAGVVSPMVSATIGVASLRSSGIVSTADLFLTWQAWWLGDAIGALIVAPLLLTWRAAPVAPATRRRVAEALLLGGLLAASSLLLFEWTRDGLASLLSPLLIWAAIRFEQRGAAGATFLVSVVAVWATARGHGPFLRGSVEEGLFVLQLFMAVTAATFLVLGAVTRERRLSEAERRRTAREIRESEEKYRTLTETVDDFLWINDPDGRLIFANRRWEEAFGTVADVGPANRWIDRVHPEDHQALRTARNRGVRSGSAYEVECRVRRRTGDYRWILARVVPVNNPEGEVSFWFGAAADVHELKAAQEQLLKAKEEAEAANRSKDQFLTALSHELRTPLAPVVALSSTLERNLGLPPEIRRQLEIVRRNAELEARLIDDLLDLTRIARGKLPIEQQPVDLQEALDHVLEICREEATAKGLHFAREGDDHPTIVLGDPARLRQIFWNLLRNAVKFTPFGGRIRLRTSLERGRIVVEISDTGAGIEPAAMSRIFEPFEQAGRKIGGLGLGLAISSALVEAHGGTLTASSEGLGHGSIFRVDLPVLQDAATAFPPVATASTMPAMRSKRVLLVEDHADTLTATAEMLAELSCEVVAAASVGEALAAAESHVFDLVVSDLGLPDGTGLDLMRRLRELYGLSGIAVTGFGMEEDLHQSREAGFVAHLVKPITFDRLAGAIAKFFEERSDPAPIETSRRLS